jgi:competence protein ComEA
MQPNEIHIENLSLVENELTNKQPSTKKYDINNPNQIESFTFDPNDVNLEDLIKLGFKEKTAETFIKFRSNGFKFKQKEDLKKVYGISEKLYSKLEPYILIKSIKNSAQEEKKSTTQKTNSVSKKLELNEADSLSLIALKGVGPGFAKRILKYRNLLGGFNSINQVKEIYGMTDELFNLIETQCSINSYLITKLNINTIEFKALNKHPCITYELTKRILNFRKQTKITESNLNEAMQDNGLAEKLKPYLQY